MKKQPPRNIYCLEDWRNEPAVQTKRASDARHIAGCRGDKIHLPQVQHTERVLRIPAAIHVRTLPELYDSIHCLSRQTE